MKNLYDKAINAAIEAGNEILKVYHSDDFKIVEKDDKSPLTIADRAAHNTIVSHLKQTSIPILSEEGRDIPFEERKTWNQFWLVDPLDGTKEFIKRNDEFTVNIALIQNNKPIFGVVYAPVLKDLYVGISGIGSWLYKGPEEKASVSFIKSKGTKLMSSESARRTPHTAYRVIASRSHLNNETKNYLEKLEAKKGEIEVVSKGSSLKLCMVASGEADEYPRLGPTMEWDVAAAHAVVYGSGKKVLVFGTDQELKYNKEELLNPYFLVI